MVLPTTARTSSGQLLDYAVDMFCIRQDGQDLPDLSVSAPAGGRFYYVCCEEKDLMPDNAADFKPQLPNREWSYSDKQMLLEGLYHAKEDPRFSQLQDRVYYFQADVMKNRYSKAEVQYALHMVARKGKEWLLHEEAGSVMLCDHVLLILNRSEAYCLCSRSGGEGRFVMLD